MERDILATSTIFNDALPKEVVGLIDNEGLLEISYAIFLTLPFTLPPAFQSSHGPNHGMRVHAFKRMSELGRPSSIHHRQRTRYADPEDDSPRYSVSLGRSQDREAPDHFCSEEDNGAGGPELD